MICLSGVTNELFAIPNEGDTRNYGFQDPYVYVVCWGPKDLRSPCNQQILRRMAALPGNPSSFEPPLKQPK